MNLQDWLRSGDLLRRPSNRGEITRLLEVARRDLADAAASGLSLDRQFAIAYEAAYSLAIVVLRAEGYRTRSGAAGHHWLAFAVLPEIVGEMAVARARYYQSCRRKRHQATYEQTGVATEAEVRELVADVEAFREEVLAWLHQRHPESAPGK
jgi:uncharacterized protein (UPF0332 family)